MKAKMNLTFLFGVVRRALGHNASGFSPKNASTTEIGEAIRSVLDCGNWLLPDLAVVALPVDPSDTDLAKRLAPHQTAIPRTRTYLPKVC